MSSSSRTIYVDMDDVLCEAARHFLLIVEREFGKKVAYEQLTDFDVGHACGLRPEERDELYRIVHRPEELLDMAPIAEAVSAVECWAKQGFEIAIVTGRPPESIEASLAWLAKHKVPHGSFIVVDKYSRFSTERSRAISLAELATRQFCWAVEDSWSMAEYLARRMNVPVALIDCPWNRAGERYGRISRYRGWHELAEALPARLPRSFIDNSG